MGKILALQPAGQLLLNQSLPMSGGGFWPTHTFNVIIPGPTVTPLACMVCFHGGSGSKENFMRNLGLCSSNPPTLAGINWQQVNYLRTVFIIPDGSFCDGTVGAFNPNGANTVSSANPNGVRTWSNYFMWSQRNDMAYVADMKTYASTTHFNGVLTPGVSAVGHSNGSFFLQRVLREAPTTFTHYCMISGPVAKYLFDNPVNPSPTFRPRVNFFGAQDDVINIINPSSPDGNGNFNNAFLFQDDSTLSVADVLYPALNEFWGPFQEWAAFVFEATGQTVAYNSGVTTSLAIGNETIWTDTTGNFELHLLSQAGHQIKTYDQCYQSRILGKCLDFVKRT